ncbi:unnamed protein product [Pieris macdunnoughi]|uniref:RNA-directed DNA polymerase n=1 Tax=Pieris macdunnoughi TaxID=345717 RepID=A0A821XT09_9NEOP|nr:unnamed protein product [Pieris macdunnoughi]
MQNPVQNPLLNPIPRVTPDQDQLPSPHSDLIDLGPIDLDITEDDINLDFDSLQIPSPNESNSDNPNISHDDYSQFLKSNSKKDIIYNTTLQEHNEHLLKTTNKIILIPTSIDLDESNPYVSEVILNTENKDDILNIEKELNSFLKIHYENKIVYLLFTKVHHFDEMTYPSIFDALKKVRNDLLLSSDSTNISISDFRNPFDKLSYTKIYNIIIHIFHNTNIPVDVYRNKIIYPTLSERSKILHENHDIPIAGHLGSVRMYKRIKESYYWKGMRSDIENYVKTCRSCQENKALRKINKAPMEITTTSTAPFQRIALDIVGPLPESGTAKLKFILTIQDDLTKYSIAYPIRWSTTAEETSDCLIHFISLFGIPKTILTDQGTNFTADLFKSTCKFLKIKQLWSSPYHPQTQGALERSHSTLKEYLKSFINNNQDNWPTYVYTAILTYNITPHTTTKYTPYELIFGHKPYIPNSVFEEEPTTYLDYIKMLQHKLKFSREIALQNITKSKETSKSYYDSHTKPPPRYKPGDYVYIKNHLRLRKALSPIWKGPYKIIMVNNNHTATLLINRKHVTHHFDQMKPALIPK